MPSLIEKMREDQKNLLDEAERLAHEANMIRLQAVIVKGIGDLLATIAARPDLTAEDIEFVSQHVINQLAKHPDALGEYIVTAKRGYNNQKAVDRLSEVLFGDE